MKLEVHTDMVRDLELKIAADKVVDCDPTGPGAGDYDSNAGFPSASYYFRPIRIELKNPITIDQVYQDTAHELGHVLGLGHSRGLMAATQPKWDPVGWTVRSPSAGRSLFPAARQPTQPKMRLTDDDRDHVRRHCDGRERWGK